MNRQIWGAVKVPVSEPGTSCFSQLICDYLCGGSLQPAGACWQKSEIPNWKKKKKSSAEMDGYWNQCWIYTLTLSLCKHTYFLQAHSSRWQVVAQYSPQDQMPGQKVRETHTGQGEVTSFHRRNMWASSAVGRCFYADDITLFLSWLRRNVHSKSISISSVHPTGTSWIVWVFFFFFFFCDCFPSCDTREKITACDVVMEIRVSVAWGFLGTGRTWRAEIAAESCKRILAAVNGLSKEVTPWHPSGRVCGS